MSRTPIVPAGDDRSPRGRDRLAQLALLAVVLIAVLLITDDAAAAVNAVTVLVGLVR